MATTSPIWSPTRATQTIPGLLIYRFDGPLVFPNAERFAHEVRALIKADAPSSVPAQGAPVRALIIDLEATADMDTTAADQFVDLVAALRRSGVRVMLARSHGALREFMRRDGIIETIGEGAIFPRVLDAVRSFEADAGD